MKRDRKIINICVSISAVALLVIALLLVLPGILRRNMQPVRFDAGIKKGDKVYADIVSITPYMGAKKDGALSDVLCYAQTAEGKGIYVVVDKNAYKEEFDHGVEFPESFGAGTYEAVNYSAAIRIQGVAEDADKISKGLSEKLGVELVLVFDP